MKLPLVLIQDYLPQPADIIINNKKGICKTWAPPVWYEENQKSAQDILLLGYASMFPDDLCQRGIICIGEPSARLKEQNEILIFSENLSAEIVFNHIQKIYYDLNIWEQNMMEHVKKNSTLIEFIQTAQKLFGNSLFIHDNNFLLLATTPILPNQHRWEYSEKEHTYMLSLEVINDFKVNKDYIETMSTKEPSIFPSDTFGYRILYQNLWYHGNYIGRICINELLRRFKESDFFLLSVFSEIIIWDIVINGVHKLENTANLEQFLIRLIENKPIDEKLFDTLLMYYGWSANDDYFCICLTSIGQDQQIGSVSFLCNRLKEIFPFGATFSYKNQIVILVNSTLSEYGISEAQAKLSLFIREGLLKAGISSLFRGIADLKHYYNEAIFAYETGVYRQNTFWIYAFDN